MSKKEAPEVLAISVVEAGRMIGLGRNASYEAARKGEIPVMKFGSRLRVPLATWRRMLGAEAADAGA